MAFVSFPRRAFLPVLLSAALTTCSISDGLTPPANVDKGTRVSSISPARAPPARMAPAVRMPPVESQASYPVSGAPVGSSQGSVDYLDTPNLAGSGQAARAAPGRRSGRLPMIDSDEAMAAGQQTENWGGTQNLAIPSGGVNMDDELGAEPVVGLAQEQQQQIAEGNATEPVVDGIGTDTPTQLNQPAPQAIPLPAAQAQMSRAPTWSDGSPVVAPTRVPEEDEAEEMAMLRPNNPMMSQPAAPVDPSVMPASELACRRELKRMGVLFDEKPPISQGPACQVPYPVSLRGLSGNIGVKPAVTLNCQVTLAFAKWVKNELAPSARYRYWSGIRTIQPLGGYSCRRMNNSRQRYNPMSEHARGNAIDVGKFVLKNGHAIDVRKKGLFSFREGRLLKAVRSDSCRYFNTVLGPGSNPEHWNHFHFDLRSRKSGKVYCN
ncbi:extensin family protein [Rhizobium bangladeshense]|uniref:Extensin family protein n=1 Tax=Rhizobium bangladeshense TaxID=1138189 RepID=A0ABS7LCW9_9HYPH|nr:extensin family protein [Rhizobium bangladeshense]MBX4870888.1 extensin family protein [Rhizobium bangladeshense]MBX4876371.1 extensin family protein [Rhizobium bangladeshense]MBX4887335.1 extensin family protein [Rhizobium bangladeshense]MBX4900753.1 extensin family protein [Rhizobium bangladeshense]MBY3589129.1 extensin family protein [Rhizobium bangladeshense]